MTTAATIEKTVTTYNYLLSFKGWAQCRLAVDPDPSNAPRGVSGYTFAVPGEPDLDQIINFQNRESVIQRSHCPKIGVDVRSGVFYKARVNGDEQEFEHREEIDEKHPLYRARVDLCGNPVFDSRNSTIVYNGYGLISPFELQVESLCQKTRISRRYDVCPQNPVTDLASIPIDRLAPHVMCTDVDNPTNLCPGSTDQTTPGSANILLESGILDKVAYRRERLRNLECDLAGVRTDDSQNRISIAALEKRISELKIDDPINRRTAQLGAKVLVPYSLNSRQATVNGKRIEAGDAWRLEMWLGGWDADALSFFVLGTVLIVLNSDPLQ